MNQSSLESHLPTMPSNQKFGYFFTLVFAVGAAYAFWKGSTASAVALVAVAVAFVVVAISSPKLLAPLNRLWFGLGMLLGKIVSPIVLGFIFFLLITPIAVISRFLGRDALLMKKRTMESYWVERNPMGPHPESFKSQF